MKIYLTEYFKISIRSIRSHLLRTVLTILIIAFGIMALMGILTAIEAIKSSINYNFTNMGANTFTIRNKGFRLQVGKRGKNNWKHKEINYSEAMEFKEKFNMPAIVSISYIVSPTATIKYKNEKTNPNISVIGADENYLLTSGYEIEQGRNFNYHDVKYSSHVVIIGYEIARKLFKDIKNPIDRIINIGGIKYRVIGVMKEKGTSMGFSGDRTCIIPINNARMYFQTKDKSYTISVMTNTQEILDLMIEEASSLFRKIRKIKPDQENNFEISKSDNIAKMLIDNISLVTLMATLIGFITLLGASVGLMNIMLVSVAERTREIGVRKAIGATRNDIKNQFIFETVVIGQMGGILGILLGIIVGNGISILIEGPFVIPWGWVIVSFFVCLLVGILSGLLPALKAANLEPIEALRYE